MIAKMIHRGGQQRVAKRRAPEPFHAADARGVSDSRPPGDHRGRAMHKHWNDLEVDDK
jgi:hypothetical protein